MRYRVTCLTPTLVGDGQKLSPIDYMVWKDHVNVLDQHRILKLLSRGPRLEGYLGQLKKAETLDFASWGGFAQNFAGRRIPFEHPTSIALWEKARAEQLFISTFAAGATGPYLPASALKGALRTAAVSERWSEATLANLANGLEDRLPRSFSVRAEDAVLGGSGNSRMKRVALSDSNVIAYSGMKVYLLRVATLVSKGPRQSSDKLELGWQGERGAVDSRKVDESTPIFAEMAAPGATFEGVWREQSDADRSKLFTAARHFAEALLDRHLDYAQRTGLARLSATIASLKTKLEQSSDRSCLLPIGWGGGLLGKSAYLKTEDESYRKILRKIPSYESAIRSGMPFPKTRHVVFEGAQPASLPGWVLLELE